MNIESDEISQDHNTTQQDPGSTEDPTPDYLRENEVLDLDAADSSPNGDDENSSIDLDIGIDSTRESRGEPDPISAPRPDEVQTISGYVVGVPKPAVKKPEIPNGVVTRILKLDEDLKSKKFRVQRDSVKAINISMSLFIQLLTKACEVVLSTSGSSIPGKRGENTLELDHLVKAVKRYDLLAFMNDVVAEMNAGKTPSTARPLAPSNAKVGGSARSKRPADMVRDDDSEGVDMDTSGEPSKKLKTSQMSITSFFNRPATSA